jgi:hypothetical protein
VQLALPAVRHAAGRSGHGLAERVVMRRSENGTLQDLLGRSDFIGKNVTVSSNRVATVR